MDYCICCYMSVNFMPWFSIIYFTGNFVSGVDFSYNGGDDRRGGEEKRK